MPQDQYGLTSSEAQSLLATHGPNALPEKPPPSNLSILLAQVQNPLVYVLLAAGTVTAILGEIPDTIIIVFSVLTNGVLGFIQERKASRALSALKSLIHPQAKIIRDGKIKNIDAKRIVPGDIAILDEGAKVPADGEVLDASRLFVSEAILTGESQPVSKSTKDKIFMGTIVSSGRAHILVESTGADTEIGKIALDVQERDEDTPLRKQLKRFSRQLSILVIFLTAFVFAVGLLTGMPLEEIFITAVALAVSSIPEGILVGTTIILAFGMQRILKRKGLVRHLMSAETLGGVTTVCVDKTGTLTAGKMQVVDCLGLEEEIVSQAIIANDLDDPITIAAWEWASKKTSQPKQLLAKHRRFDSLPFNSKNRFFASLNRHDRARNMIHVNGAPEFLLKWSNLSAAEKRRVQKQIDDLTSQGKRIIGLARKPVKASQKTLSVSAIQSGKLQWLGLLSFSDPVRPGVREALEKVKRAGLKFIVITGDYPATAVSVLNSLGNTVDPDSVVTGKDLEHLSSSALAKKLKKQDTLLFARTTPNQKLKIVEALKTNGEVVAMMGDGVNDAPALQKADIGIVVGEATDVAKETAELVLLDSNFATIVAAIEEGRGIFDNIRKVLLYLMSDSFEEIVIVVISIVASLPLPVTAAQILWINLVSDGFPDIALTVDPKAPGIMDRSPRSPRENIVSFWMRDIIFVVSLVGGVIAFLIYYYFLRTSGDLTLARSAAFATLGVNSLIYVYSIRTLTDPFWRENPFDNPWLNLSVLGGLALQFFPFLTPSTRAFFGLSPLQPLELAFIFGASILMFIIIEIGKVFMRSHKI